MGKYKKNNKQLNTLGKREKLTKAMFVNKNKNSNWGK